MNIAIDIDDTLTDSFAHFQKAVAEYFGADIEEVRARNISHANLPPEWEAQNDAFAAATYGIYAPTTPFKPDAKAALDTLRTWGHRVIILTGRNTRMYKDPYATSREELANGNIVYDKLICTTEKGKACREEKIDLLIDDVAANCEMAKKEGIRALQFESPANREEKNEFPRVHSWAEALQLISKM